MTRIDIEEYSSLRPDATGNVPGFPSVLGTYGIEFTSRPMDTVVASLGPRHWYRADTYTLSGANLATLPNRNTAVGGSLAVVAGTITAPTEDATLGGAQSITFSGTQQLQSSLPASEFRFRHNGAGKEEFVVFYLPTAAGANRGLLSTRSVSGTAIGSNFYLAGAAASLQNVVGSGAANILNAPVAGVFADNTAYVAASSYGEAAPTKANLFRNAAVVGTATTTGAPAAGDPQSTLFVGSLADGAFFIGRIADVLIFDRVLTPYERQAVYEYIASRYGIAAPVWSAEDRAILQLNPFSWIRADYYATTSGKVTAFLDKVLPGHSLTQGTVANQVADPVVDAALNGKLAAAFGGGATTRYTSSLASGAFSFLHNGLGGSSFSVVVPTATANGFVWSTGSAAGLVGGSQIGSSLSMQQGLGQLFFRIANGAANMVNSTPNTTLNLGVGLYLGTQFTEAEAPEWFLRKNGTTITSGNATPAATTSAPSSTLNLGTDGAGANPGQMRWADQILFNRVLTNVERSTVQQYMARYGL